MERSRLRALAVIGAVASGCAHGDVAGRTWNEVRTGRITLVTDLDRNDARDRAAELDRLGATLGDLYEIVRPDKPAPVRPARVVLFSDCDDLRQTAGRDLAGYVTQGFDFGNRLVVTCDASGWTETAVHELTHDLNARYFALPAWLEEGLAVYYSTLEIDDGKAIVGRAPDQFEDDWTDPTPLPSLGRLLVLPERALVSLPRNRGYFAAWYLTQTLANSGPDFTRRFQQLLSSLAAGMERAAAFSAAFGDVLPRIAHEYRSIGQASKLVVRHIPYRQREAGRIAAERTLRPGEAHALFIELRPRGRDLGAYLRDRAARLERADPTWPGRLYWRALVGHVIDHLADRPVSPASIQLLRRYVREVPTDGQGWASLVRLEIERRRSRAARVESPTPDLEQLEADVARLVKLASTPGELLTVAWYRSLRGQTADGLAFARRALALEPSCASCWDMLAQLNYQDGRPDDAVTAEQRAIALAAEGRVPPDMLTRLRLYQRTARGSAQ